MLTHLKYIHIKKLYLLVGDILILVGMANLVTMTRILPHSYLYILSPSIIAIPMVLALYLFSMYSVDRNPFKREYLINYVIASCTGSLILAWILYFIIGTNIFTDYWLALTLSVLIIAMYAWRIVFIHVSKMLKPKPILIVGAGDLGRMVYNELQNWKEKYKVVGFIDDKESAGRLENGSKEVIGNSNDLYKIAGSRDVSAVIIALKHEKSSELIKNLLNCRMKGILIYDSPTFYETLSRKIPVEALNDNWFVSTTLYALRKSFYSVAIKRVVDIFMALIGMILFSPVILVIMALIKLDTAGPILYRQTRVGLNDDEFELLKFRSMKVDAEKNGAVWAGKNDERVTRVGRWIRKMRMDEIPQLWNVLRGDMSFIGPRPERPEFVQMLEKGLPYYSVRHAVKPGVTGWAQVNYPYGASVKDALEKLGYELFYMKNMSFLLDIHILLRTVRVVMFGSGAR